MTDGRLRTYSDRPQTDSPPLVSHAPALAQAALLPHLDHACEGLHTWLPLGYQRHLPLHAHVRPAGGHRRNTYHVKTQPLGLTNERSVSDRCFCDSLDIPAKTDGGGLHGVGGGFHWYPLVGD